MKLLALLLGALGVVGLVLPLMVVAVIATHPWLGVGAFTAAPAVVQSTPVAVAAPAVAAVPVPTALGPLLFSPEALIAEARKWLGVPYDWGGCSTKGVDCSCFVMNVLATFGIKAPRVTTDQVRWATPVPRGQEQVGDLVFFNNTCSGCGANPTHVGLYIGGGLMINAGDPVQIGPAFGPRYAESGRPRR